ncbi:acyltransferase family protein [Bradyrhizobium sp.]|jgi:peptidoglycan/LPS O-acetylase OafA/YrhL|uniref:acyltransferase family protein n=1 Tax=Bradyrhizobium sp. TaxID=376 RepID=UPI003C1E4D9F
MTRPGRDADAAAYRADIDGLRAISILMVVGYHAQPWLVPGGFVGVDIFFVISGFLITRIILTQQKARSFSLPEFYARRVRRIFPALIVVLAATYTIGWFVLLPDDFSLLGENVIASVAFVSNLFQLSQSGYFAPDTADNPLLHLWSLGIEEQFYILWPLVLLMLSGSRRRRFFTLTIAIASFGASLTIFFGHQEWSFYSPLSRAWELLAGGLVANRYVEAGEHERPSSPLRDDLTATIGLSAILGAAFGLNKSSLFPGPAALLPVLGAVLMIVSPNSRVNKIILASRPMVLIGLISYPLYLWHWPLLTYLAITRHGVPNFLEIWITLIAAVVLSWLTYRMVEIPIRRRPAAVPGLSFGLLAIGILGMATAGASGFGFRFSPVIRDIAMIPQQNNAGLRDKCFLEAPGARLDADCIEQGEKPLLFSWGDSNAAALYPGLKKAQSLVSFRLARFAAPACAPILATAPRCDEANNIVFGFIKSSHPEIVLLHAMWGLNNDLGKLGETIRALKALDIPRIVILGPVPVWKRTLPFSLVNAYRLRHVIADRIADGVSGPQDDARMAAFSAAAGVQYISAWHVLCNPDGCLTRVGPTADDVVASDIVHLTNAGSVFLVEAIGGDLFPGQPTINLSRKVAIGPKDGSPGPARP